MKHFNSFARGSFAMLLMGFALSGGAAQPEKIFSVNMAPKVVAPATGVLLTATIKNATPNGNSSINSLKLIVPANVTIDTTFLPTATWVGQISANASSVSMSNMSPLRPGESFILTLKANFNSASLAGCAPVTWTSAAWTGSSFSGDSFRLLGPTETTTTRTSVVASDLAVSFQTEPSNVEKDKAVTPAVAVSVTACNAPYPAPTQVTLACNGACGISGNTATTPANGVATFPLLKFSTPGVYKLTASAASATSAPSAEFTVFAGILACQPQVPFLFSSLPPGVDDIGDTGYAAGQRGAYNKDGVTCVPVEYTFTNNILDFPLQMPPKPQQVSLVWNIAGNQRGAAFEYTATWNDEPVDATTLLPVTGKTKVSWQSDSNGPIFVTGQTCLSPNLPSPYGELGGTGLPNSTRGTTPSITVANATGLPPVGTTFPIMIGNERMSATRTAVATLTVVRGDGMTPDASNDVVPAHLAGAKIMSTPLPIDPASSKQAQMCIKAEVWVAVGACTPNPALPCVRFSTTVFDIGDGLMIR